MEDRPNLTLNIADTAVFYSLIVKGVVGDGFVEKRPSHQLLKQAFDLAKTHINKVIAPLPANDKWTAFQSWISYFQF